MRKALFAAVILAIAATGCTIEYAEQGRGTMYYADAYAAPQEVVVTSAPPPPQVTVTARPGKPDPNAVWLEGHWAWQGRWVWLDGHWETPRVGYAWTAPVVVTEGGGYRYHAGYWRPAAQEPPPVYRGGVTVVGGYQGDGDHGGYHGGGYPGGGTVQVNPAQPQPGTTTVYVQPQQPQPRPGTTTVVVQPAQPQPRPGTTTVVVQPAQPQPRPGTTTVVVQPQPQPQPPPPFENPHGGVNVNVNVRPGVVQAGVVNPVQPVQPGTQIGVGVRPGVVQAGVVNPVQPVQPGTQLGVGVRPGTVQAGVVNPVRPGLNVNVGGNVSVGNNPALPTNVQLQCSASGAVPRGAQLMIQGNGFGADTRVQIGGQFAPIVRTSATQAVVQVPNDSPGGVVSVTSGGQTVSCGSVRTMGAGGR